jgi:hypothetical protein
MILDTTSVRHELTFSVIPSDSIMRSLTPRIEELAAQFDQFSWI